MNVDYITQEFQSYFSTGIKKVSNPKRLSILVNKLPQRLENEVEKINKKMGDLKNDLLKVEEIIPCDISEEAFTDELDDIIDDGKFTNLVLSAACFMYGGVITFFTEHDNLELLAPRSQICFKACLYIAQKLLWDECISTQDFSAISDTETQELIIFEEIILFSILDFNFNQIFHFLENLKLAKQKQH